MKVIFEVRIIADTDRPSVLAENLTAQLRHELKDDPNDMAVVGTEWTELDPTLVELSDHISDKILEVINQESLLRKMIPAKEVKDGEV